MEWWANYAEYFNGKEQIIGKFSTIYSVYTDASNWSYGANWSYDWIIGSFHENDTMVTSPILSHHFLPLENWVYKAHINTKEMWADWQPFQLGDNFGWTSQYYLSQTIILYNLPYRQESPYQKK